MVVDPGDAGPVFQLLEQSGLTLEAILITHHCHDHIDGVVELISKYPVPVYAPAKEFYDFPHTPVADGDLITLAALDLKLTVMEVPGHTLGHVAYYSQPLLFCGDTLFSCGCGRLHEGTAEQMHQSLQRLAQLPADTLVYCAHEYTLNNLAFALELEPDNLALQKRQQEVIELRTADKPSLPTTIGLELATNPFLRCDNNTIRQSLKLGENTVPAETFRILREMKNNY